MSKINKNTGREESVEVDPQYIIDVTEREGSGRRTPKSMERQKKIERELKKYAKRSGRGYR